MSTRWTFVRLVYTQKRRVAFSTPFGLSLDFLHGFDGFCCIAASLGCECIFTNVLEVPVEVLHLAKA